MTSIVFDAGPIISLTTTNLLWIIEALKKQTKTIFYIPEAVKYELVDHPLHTKKFKFEALQVKKLLEKKVIRVYDSPTLQHHTKKLLELANNTLQIKKHPMKIVQEGEMASIAAYHELQANALVMDERITRLLLEDMQGLARLMSRRLHRKVKVDAHQAKLFKKKAKNIRLIRSFELAAVAFEKGLLKSYLVNVPHARKELLESILWGVKLHGCAVTPKEINTVVSSLAR
jgi:predicted nucleic acid-binding protein